MDHESAPRVSMLDVVQERLQREGRTQLETTNRLFYVARLTENVASAEELGNTLENNLSKNKAFGEATGLLLIMHNACLHVIEGPNTLLSNHLRFLHDTPLDKRLFFDLKVVTYVEDIENRIFSTWAFKPITVQKAETAPDLQPAAAEELVSTIYINILKLGQRLGDLTKAELQSALSSVRKDHKDILPTHEELLSACSSNYCFSLEEFVETYFAVVDVVLDHELVWPLPGGLTY